MSNVRSLLCFLFALCAAQPAFAFQGGYKTEKHKDLGLEFPSPNSYETVALQPDEAWRVLAYIAKPRKARKKEQERIFAQRGRASLSVLWIDYKPDPELDEDATPPPTGRTSTTKDPEVKAPPKLITTLERYVDQRLPGWKLGALEKGKDRAGYEGEYGLLLSTHARNEKRAAFVYSFRNEKRTIAFVGSCHVDDFEDQSRIWKYMAERLEIKEPSTAARDKWMQYYERRPKFRDAEYRTQVRCDLVRGWEAEDLENYIVVYHTKDQPLVRQICSNIESIRKKYIELFPPTKEINAVSTVRICRDRAEYIAYSGIPTSAGYWNWVTEELVLYDAAVKEKGKRPKDDDTFIVLYHEAFHQYIYYSAGRLSPHSWFNEGYGDFFSGSLVKGGKVKKVNVNPWRIAWIQHAIETGSSVTWKKIIRYEQKEYYANPNICYAQGWSMIYFLNNSRVVKKHDRWSQILPVYFDTLKAENTKGLERLPEDKRKNGKALMIVGKKARDIAVTEAFKDVDLDELEAAWKKYISGIKFKR